MQGNVLFQVHGKYYMYRSVTCTVDVHIKRILQTFYHMGKKCRTESELRSYMSTLKVCTFVGLQ